MIQSFGKYETIYKQQNILSNGLYIFFSNAIKDEFTNLQTNPSDHLDRVIDNFIKERSKALDDATKIIIELSSPSNIESLFAQIQTQYKDGTMVCNHGKFNNFTEYNKTFSKDIADLSSITNKFAKNSTTLLKQLMRCKEKLQLELSTAYRSLLGTLLYRICDSNEFILKNTIMAKDSIQDNSCLTKEQVILKK